MQDFCYSRFVSNPSELRKERSGIPVFERSTFTIELNE